MTGRTAAPSVAPRGARAASLSLLAALTLAACGGGARSSVVRLGEGMYRLSCQSQLTQCLQRAETLCRNAPYDVLRAQDRWDRFGGEVGSSQVVERTSTATIRCSATGRPLLPEEEVEADAAWKLPPRETAPAPAAAARSTAPSPPASSPTPHAAPPSPPSHTVVPSTDGGLPSSTRTPSGGVCVPGTTQACVGPAACSGGQSCLPDGSGFGSCDCGAQGAQPLKSAQPGLR